MIVLEYMHIFRFRIIFYTELLITGHDKNTFRSATIKWLYRNGVNAIRNKTNE